MRGIAVTVISAIIGISLRIGLAQTIRNGTAATSNDETTVSGYTLADISACDGAFRQKRMSHNARTAQRVATGYGRT